MDQDSLLEDVFTVDDWYDGPLAGFALYKGAPHHYCSGELSEEDVDERRFELIPVSKELLEAGLEAKAIFERWSAVRQREHSEAVVSEAEFGALPEDRERYTVLRAMIAPLETPGRPESIIVRGRFELGCKHVQWRDDSPPGTA